MRPLRGGVLLLGLLLAAMALVSVWRHHRMAPASTAPGNARDRAAATRPVALAPTAPGPHGTVNRSMATSADAFWNAPLSAVEPELRRRAQAGDVNAAGILGSRAARCWNRLHAMSRAELVEEGRRELEDIDRDSPYADLRRQNITRQRKHELDFYDDCAAIGERRLGDFLAWLERAGRAGNQRAQVDFASYAFDEWPTPESMIARVEEAARRRAVARAWLEDQVDRGRESALMVYTGALRGDGALYVRDIERAETYAYVLELVQSRRIGRFQQRWDEGPRPYGDDLTAAQWKRIHAEGRRLYLASFANTPLYPQ